MKITYDSEAPVHEKCRLIMPDGTEKTCGCFDIKVETTEIETGKPIMELSFKRWGAASKRKETHKKVSDKAKEVLG